MEQNTLEVTEQSAVSEFASIRDMVNLALRKDFGQELVSNGLSTGFKCLDKVTGGFQKGQLTCIAVHPGMGKTAFLLSIANNLAIKNNHSVAIFSSERSNQKITNRLIETETGMSVEKLQKGHFKASEKDHILSRVGSIAKAKIFLDDTPALSISELVPKARLLKIKHNVELIIIDYLELLTTSILDTESRSEQLSRIVQTIKEVARELNIPVVLFSQIPGSYLGTENSAKPSLKVLPVYLSEIADLVMFLHRSDLYPRHKEYPGKGMVEVIVAKNQDLNQQTSVPLTFIESISKFVDFS
jgi:replicative DNA helicase